MERNTKFVDLHKVASLLRDIQTSGQAELESEIAHEEAVVEDNAFNTAAAKAAVAGHSEFEFNGKKYPVKMSKEEAQKLLDSQVNDEQPVIEEPKAEEDNAEEVLTKGMEDEMADQIADKLEDDEEINELNVPNDKEKVKARIEKLMQMAKDARDAGDSNKAYSIERSSEMTALHQKLSKLESVEEAQSPAQKAAFQKMLDAKKGANKDDKDDDEVEEAVTEEPVVEADVELTNDALKTILSLAGMRAVTDADINQPEDGAEPVEEYSNSPDEEYADTDTQLNKLSGGVNGPKAIPAVGNDGHNRLVMKLKKAYSDME